MERPSVIILIDALGFDLAERAGFAPGRLPSRTRLRTVFGFSQAALTSMMTGLAPSEHGLWMMYSFSEGRSPFGWLKAMPGSDSTRRIWVKRLIRWKLDRIDRVTSYYNLYTFPKDILCLLDLPARKQLFQPGGVEGHRTIFDEALKRGMRLFIRYYDTDERTAFDELEAALGSGGPGLYFLYTAGLDSTLHRYGTGHPETAAHLAWYEKRIDSILSSAPDARMTVLGDHGMCDVEAHVDVKGVIDGIGLRAGRDYIPVYDSTMARFRVGSEGARKAILEALGGLEEGRTVEDEEMRKLGVFFPDRRFGDIVYLLDPGRIIVPSYMGDPVAGMHGYHPDTPEMYSVMFTNGDFGEEESELTVLPEYFMPGFSKGVKRG